MTLGNFGGGVAVVGAGPAGLTAADVVARAGMPVTVFDRMPSVGRKLLMAGRGGLNLTHNEPLPDFLTRYGAATDRLRRSLEAFPPDALKAWCEGLGQPVFVGSSGRVFPTAMKASPLLRAWMARLQRLDVRFALRHRWTGWTEDGRLRFEGPDGSRAVEAEATVLAMGGASWPRLGSDGQWASTLRAAGFPVLPFKPANCGFVADWSPFFSDKFHGQPVKNIALRFEAHRARGDLMITRHGLEGGAVYGIAAPLREAVLGRGDLLCSLELRPDLPVLDLIKRIGRRKPKDSLSTALKRTLGLAPVGIALLHEAARLSGSPLAGMPDDQLAALINAVPIRLTGTAPLDRAISTAGGLDFMAVDPSLMLEARPGTFVAGEMLDWEAPTGGYLLQACFATGVTAGEGARDWVAGARRGDRRRSPEAEPHQEPQETEADHRIS